jgi:hypothetical protein
MPRRRAHQWVCHPQQSPQLPEANDPKQTGLELIVVAAISLALMTPPSIALGVLRFPAQPPFLCQKCLGKLCPGCDPGARGAACIACVSTHRESRSFRRSAGQREQLDRKHLVPAEEDQEREDAN